MKKLFIALILGGILFYFPGYNVKAETGTATLKLTVYQVVVKGGVAGITGPAADSKVELYDNLGEELLASGTTSSNGMVEFTLDETYPLSGRGLYYSTVMVAGVNNGVHYCARDYTCQLKVFSVDGLDPDMEGGILIVHVVRSNDPSESVEGVQVNAWPTDLSGIPLTVYAPNNTNKPSDYNGVPCRSNAEGYCAAYLESSYKWEEDDLGVLFTYTTLMFDKLVTYDGASIKVPAGAVKVASITVDEEGKLDDCILRTAPTDKIVNPSCRDKIHQTATVQAQATADPSQYLVINTGRCAGKPDEQ